MNWMDHLLVESLVVDLMVEGLDYHWEQDLDQLRDCHHKPYHNRVKQIYSLTRLKIKSVKKNALRNLIRPRKIMK